MATQFQVQQFGSQAGSPGSPGSSQGSPGSPGRAKLNRAQRKKLFKTEVDKLVEAVKLIPIFVTEVDKLEKKTGKRTVSFVDPNNQPHNYEIGRAELKEFIGLTVKGLQSLTNLAFTLNKTQRETAANSGFLAPARFDPVIANFFSQATIGPIVTGVLVSKTDKAMNTKMVPESKSLEKVDGSNLNNTLYFTAAQIGNVPNPLYSIISPGTLTPLFALHSYYSNMAHPADPTRLSASTQMRQLLAGLMARTIQSDVGKITAKYANRPDGAQIAQRAQQAGQILLSTIDPKAPIANVGQMSPGGQGAWNELINSLRQGGPVPGVNPNASSAQAQAWVTLQDVGKIGDEEIFNPNYFLYAHFSKLISNAKDPANKLDDANLNELRPAVAQFYVGLLPAESAQAIRDAWEKGFQEIDGVQRYPSVENVVLIQQQKSVAFARAYKNQIHGTRQRQIKKAQKEAEKAQQQQQTLGGMGMTSLPGVGGLPGVMNLPMAGGLGGLGGL